MTTEVLSLAAIQAAIDELPDDQLSSSRRVALAHLREHGLPTTQHEDYKYTDLSSAIDIGNRSLSDGNAAFRTNEIKAVVADIQASMDAHWLLIVNGLIDDESLDSFTAAGVTVSRLSESTQELSCANPLENLNIALLHDGLHVRLSAGSELDRPIGFIIIDDANAAASMSQLRVEITLEARSTASLAEFQVSIGNADHYANSVINLTLGDKARANYLRYQNRALQHTHTSRMTVTCGRDSDFRHCGIDLGGSLVRNDIVVDLAQPGSHVDFNGLYLIGDGQFIDNHSRVDHRVGPAESHQEYRGILAGRARGVWNGKAIVHVGADGTDAEQSNHNLLLSDKAEINAKPELEIYADDVKCSHGTTVGQLDETALFYLRTRGLNKHQAKQLLTQAFAQSILKKSPVEQLNPLLEKRIGDRLLEMMQDDGS